mgnify:CR=1 FL=1
MIKVEDMTDINILHNVYAKLIFYIYECTSHIYAQNPNSNYTKGALMFHVLRLSIVFLFFIISYASLA